jgi:hypothetical protein
MTNAEKLDAFRKILGVINEQITLEHHLHRQGVSYDIIQFHRADAYERITKITAGRGGPISDQEWS